MKHLAGMLNRDPNHLFDREELDKLNRVTLLPEQLFNIQLGTMLLMDEVMEAQIADSFTQKRILEVTNTTSSQKLKQFSVINNVIYYRGLIWVPTKDLRKRIISLCHEHKLAGHPGIFGTISLVKQDYFWIGLKSEIQRSLMSCLSCQRNKPSNSKHSGLLMPLQIPEAPWNSISVDFITDLPISGGFDSIMVVVDCFTKWAEFYPCNKRITAKQTDTLFIKEVFSQHGLPKDIILDRGTQFVSSFFSATTQDLVIKQCL